MQVLLPIIDMNEATGKYRVHGPSLSIDRRRRVLLTSRSHRWGDKCEIFSYA